MNATVCVSWHSISSFSENAWRDAARVAVTVLITAIPFLAVPFHSEAWLMPSFSLNYSAWHATHIVVVDQVGRILESWKGDLVVGEAFPFPIAVFSLPSPGPISYLYVRKPHADAPDVVTDARRVLFLTQQKGTNDWQPAVHADMSVSMAWIEAGQVYAIMQLMNPGSSEIVPMSMTEEIFQQAVEAVMQLQQSFDDVRLEPDSAMRARRLIPFLDTASYECNQAALVLLAECGKEALPFLRSLLRDEGRSAMHDKLIRALTKAGGQEVKQDLIALFKEDLVYWQHTGPNLGDWWGQQPMTARYSRTLAILEQLDSLQLTEDDQWTIISFRDFWQLLPQLDRIGKGVGPDGEYVGTSQMVEMADRIIGPVR